MVAYSVGSAQRVAEVWFCLVEGIVCHPLSVIIAGL